MLSGVIPNLSHIGFSGPLFLNTLSGVIPSLSNIGFSGPLFLNTLSGVIPSLSNIGFSGPLFLNTLSDVIPSLTNIGFSGPLFLNMLSGVIPNLSDIGFSRNKLIAKIGQTLWPCSVRLYQSLGKGKQTIWSILALCQNKGQQQSNILRPFNIQYYRTRCTQISLS